MKNIFIILLFFSSSVFSQELITNNSSFSKGLASWQFGVASYDEDTPDAEFKVVNEGQDEKGSACRVLIKVDTESGNYNDAYLMYRKLAIKKGKVYRVSFYVKSNVPDDKITVSFGSGTPPDLQILESREQKFKGTKGWQRITFTFKARKDRPNVNFKDISLLFGFNHRLGNFFIDNISLKQM